MTLTRIGKRTYTKCRATGKRRYPTRSEAYREYLRIGSLPEEKREKAPTDIYKCNRGCGGWHLTTQIVSGPSPDSMEQG